jgi:hypothetical protein
VGGSNSMCDAAQPDTAGPPRFYMSGEFRPCITGGKNDVSTIKDPNRNAARLRSRSRAGVICTNPLIDSLDERYRGLSATRAGLRPRRLVLAQKAKAKHRPCVPPRRMDGARDLNRGVLARCRQPPIYHLSSEPMWRDICCSVRSCNFR